MAAPVRHVPTQVDPDRVLRLLARSANLCGQTRTLLQRSQSLLGRRGGRPRFRVVGGGVAAQPYSAEALFAAADEVEAAIRSWRNAPSPQREAVEDGLYEAAEHIRKTARLISQIHHD